MSFNEQRAVSYNASRPYSVEQWCNVQRVIGAGVDGIPGPETARKARDWQEAHSLTADGMVGPDTLQVMLNEHHTSPLPVGVWWDHTAGLSVDDAVKLLADCGVSRVCVMLDDVPEPPYPDAPVWEKALPLEQLRAIRDACAQHGLTAEAAVWPLPRRRHMSALAAQVGERLLALGAERLQLDVEGNWEHRDVKDFLDLRAAAESLVSALAPLGLPLALTTYPFHGELGSTPSLQGLVSATIPQAYSRYNKGAADYQPGGPYAPGAMQEVSAARSRKSHSCPVEMGLAAWDQVFPGATGEAAMLQAYQAAVRVGAVAVWYWSLKHIVRNEYAQRALKAITSA